jgi:hypothetical protein
MSNVIDELKVIFSAETGPLMAGLAHISGELMNMQGLSGAAQGALGALADAFTAGMAGLSADALAAGAAAGGAFANGLRGQAGSVSAAVKYLAGIASEGLKAVNTGGYDISGGRGKGVSTSGFATSVLSGGSGGSGAAGGAVRNIEVKVPLHVDGVKLGEACLQAMDRVSGITGRAHLVI